MKGATDTVTYRALPNIVIGALLLLLMCVASGRPQVFADTKSYYALGREAASLVHKPDAAQDSAEILRGRSLPPADAASETRLAYTVSASRSPYWSVLFYLAVQIGSAWLVVAMQAAVAAGVLWIAASAFGVRSSYLAIVAGLAALSSLPVQVMFLMPDLFAGLAVVSALVLTTARDRLPRWHAAALWAVLAASALFHTSHILIIAILGGGTLALSAFPRHRALIRPGAAVLMAAAVGAAGAIAFPLAVHALRGQPIYAPPFLSARLIADGPGRAVLKHDCKTGNEWGWCAYIDRPLVDVNTILWNEDPATASFQAANYDRRVRIIGEQTRFVLRVVQAYPVAVATTVLGNIGHLFLQYGSAEALGDPTARYRDPSFAVFSHIVPDTQACQDGRASCASRLNVPVLNGVIGIALLVSCLGIAALLGTAAGRQSWGAAVIFVVAALLVNAVVCGGISGNAERYQSRVTWLIPMIALVMAADWIARRRSGRHSLRPDTTSARPATR